MVDTWQHQFRCAFSLTAILAIFMAGILLANQGEQETMPLDAAEHNSEFMASNGRFSALTVRVGLLEEYKKITFQMHGCYRIESLSGDILRAAGTSKSRWRARIEESAPAQMLYSVLVASYPDSDKAMALAEIFAGQGQSAVVNQIGGPVELNGNDVVSDNTQYRVQIGNFKTEAEARALRETCDADYSPRIIREVIRKPKGMIEFFDADMTESYMTEAGFRLIPEDANATVTICSVLTVSGFTYERPEDRRYAGIVEIYLDRTGGLAALNEVDIDTYLRGVVPAEMPAMFPFDALKAQAIAARTVVMAQKATRHTNDPFELCAHVHCQVYCGVTRDDERSNRAIEETRGELLVSNGELVDAFYSAVCGGHTEDAELTWLTPMRHPALGVPCSCSDSLDYPDLTTEAGVRRWIHSSPSVCCNPNNHNLPLPADYGKKHFRWEISYTRSELEDIIRDKTGADVGTLYDILPISRGKSGRLVEIEILGSRRNLRIKRELKIRRALAKTQLESSCFLVEVLPDSTGLPMEIVFNGAGWGHGVGMCQCGAARMALDGMTYQQILEHYYSGAAVEKRYGF
jgi:peptidoglycan hydrolase-like amidase